MVMLYEGTVDGDVLNGEAAREGSDRKQPFEAKRAK